ncbi:MAG TPA: hypothetical protein DEP28_08145 [Bacteroidetes bacterium]|nr:hypothetical protein [Bacteroidota bacterium]
MKKITNSVKLSPKSGKKITEFPFILTLLLIIVLMTFSLVSYAQSNRNDPAPDGCAACGIFGGLMILIPIIWFGLCIALLVWVARDAKARGMDSSVLWMILVLITGPIGLLIYIFSRPQGNLIQCSHCNNKRLQASAKCPHCNNI